MNPATTATCDPVLFNAAWYVNLGIGYFHLFALLLMLLIQSPRVTPLNSFAGYFLNALVVFLLWQTPARQQFSCHVGGGGGSAATHTHNGTVDFGQHANEADQAAAFLYTNALAFPALDATLLAHMAAEMWDRWRDVLQRRHRVFLASGLLVALGSMLWFHAWWHVALSLLLGVLVYLGWRLLLRHYRRHLPRTCRPPPTAALGHDGHGMTTHHLSRSSSAESSFDSLPPGDDVV